MNRKFCIASLIVDCFLTMLSLCLGCTLLLQVHEFKDAGYAYADIIFCSKAKNSNGGYALQMQYVGNSGEEHSLIINNSSKHFENGDEVLIFYKLDNEEDFIWGSDLLSPLYILGGIGIASLLWLIVIIVVKLRS